MVRELQAHVLVLLTAIVAAPNGSGHGPSQGRTPPNNAEWVPTNALGLETRVGALYFDPRGADFTAWVNEFKDQTYRHWLLPEAAKRGAQGCAQFRIKYARDGALQSLRVTRSSGKKLLARAAKAALRSSRLLPLPSDFPDETLTVEVAFFYNSEPIRQPRLCTPASRATR
jgi:TonB family protein